MVLWLSSYYLENLFRKVLISNYFFNFETYEHLDGLTKSGWSLICNSGMNSYIHHFLQTSRTRCAIILEDDSFELIIRSVLSQVHE